MVKERSERMENYFKYIDNQVATTYSLCNEARSKGYDPEETVAIPLAKNMAERVEGLISVIVPQIKGSGISNRINELEEKYGKLSWKVGFVVSLETAQEKFCKFSDKKEAMEVGIRVGLAYLTLGVVASPLEGFVELKLKKRMDDGKEYFCLMFSGPIRSAGGTAAAVSVLVADYVRKQMGYAEYDATQDEVKRASTELYDYHDRITNLQYLPSEEEIEFLVSKMPIQVDGDASEKIEVSNYKDLKRIETNIIRNGFCLVIGECLCQKSPKLWKQLSDWGKEFQMEQWNFLGDFVKLQKSKKAKSKSSGESNVKIQPDYTYIKDLVAGRPILGFPLRNGGFRLRYGRSRNTGYSSAAMNPALTYILDGYIAIGTQLKLERPGKAASMSTCSTIEGPLVRLKDGSVVRVNNVEHAKKVAKKVADILYLGDILINYGDFFNRAHSLVPPGYCEEWWIKEVVRAKGIGNTALENNYGLFVSDLGFGQERIKQILTEVGEPSITAKESLSFSEAYGVPLHPRYTYYWDSLNFDEIVFVLDKLVAARVITNDDGVVRVAIPYEGELKEKLGILGVQHSLIAKEFIIIEKDDAFMMSLLINKWIESKDVISMNKEEPTCEFISNLLDIKNRARGGTFIGARMGRPEKAKVRKLDGQPHCLFPVGEEGGRLRCFQSALDAKKITSDFPYYECDCGNATVFSICEECGKRTKQKYFCKECGQTDEEKCKRHGKNFAYKTRSIDINKIFKKLISKLNLDQVPGLIKGVRGTVNRDHVLEHLAKGILRAKYNIPVNKDGTTRYDMTQLAITHFKPAEVGSPIHRLRELGYDKDIYGAELVDPQQIVELFPQDLILPSCEDAPEEGADKILYRTSKFIDTLLENLYCVKPAYSLENSEGLIGQLVIALAPHTSAGIVGRIVGFSKTQGFYAHPMFHAATRRDCDGDEACVTLLADALLNFSRKYLPSTRGSTQDAPLVLTSHLIPSEVDDMVFDMDIAWDYPVEFYDAALEYKKPWEIEIMQLAPFLNTEKQYEGMGFTHQTDSMNLGVKCSSYKLLPSMQEKLTGQMDLALKIRAVDEATVAKTVIEKHFIKDIKGNLRKFSQQQFRCVACNEKYRRPPLMGKCKVCGGKIVFTISEGSIVKYLEPALSLADHYNLPDYLKQSLELTKGRVESLFGKEKEKQEGLGKWFG